MVGGDRSVEDTFDPGRDPASLGAKPSDDPPAIDGLSSVGLVGRGGFSSVYLYQQHFPKRLVAVKVLNTSTSEPSRFVAEANLMARVSFHPHIVTIFGAGVGADGRPYLIMEYCPRGSLADRLREGSLPIDAALAIGVQLSGAVATVHQAGIIHRDVKPQNVLFSDFDQPQLADFGLSTLEPTSESLGLSPLYASPEMLADESAGDERGDVYSLAAVVWATATGFSPHQNPGETLPAILARVQAGSRPVESGPIPEPARDALLAALSRNPSDRPTAHELGRLLRDAQVTLGLHPTAMYTSDAQRQDSDAVPGIFGPPAAALPPMSRLDGSDGAANALTAIDLDGTTIVRKAPPLVRGSGDDHDGQTVVRPRRVALLPLKLIVTESPDHRTLGRAWNVEDRPLTLGRTGADIELDFSELSRRHASVTRQGNVIVVTDLGSANGTRVNGQQLRGSESAVVDLGGRIDLGGVLTLALITEDDPVLPDLAGSLLGRGRYRLARQLSSSAQGSMYQAVDTTLGRDVAIKLTSPSVSNAAGFEAAFERAAKFAASLHHPHICSVIDFGVSDLAIRGQQKRVPFICYEMMSGGSLRARLHANKVEQPEALARWAGQVTKALSYLHGHGLVHGDLKPGAVCFDSEANAYLTDFRLLDGGDPSGFVSGVPAFMAPELWEAASPTPASDQFALAAVIYLALTGTVPFDGVENPDTRARVFRRGPVPAHEVAVANDGAAIPSAVSRVLRRGLDVDPTGRYPSIEEFEEALTGSLRRRPSSSETHVFLSYQHEPSAGWAVLISRELQANHRLRTFVDTQRLDSVVPFPVKLSRAIEDAGVFVCLLAGTTLSSRWVREEIRTAFAARRPMIPVFQESFVAPDDEDDPAVNALLNYDGVHLLDRKNIHVDYTIQQLATLIEDTLRQ